MRKQTLVRSLLLCLLAVLLLLCAACNKPEQPAPETPETEQTPGGEVNKTGAWANATYVKDTTLGEGAKTLTVKITFPEGATEEDEYNVDLVYESTPVLYDADGNPTADWEHILDMVEEGGN